MLAIDDARLLLDSIESRTMTGLRDQALIATMLFSFARVSAVLRMNVEDYYQNGKRWWFRLHEKGGKYHEVPAHHGCHTMRATGITAYLANGGTIEKAAQIANHESTRTTQLYNRTADQLTLDEIERVVI